MAEPTLRETEIRHLIATLIGQQTDQWEDAFEGLCHYFLDEDIELVHHALVEKNLAQGFYWFVRYLVRIERPLGFEKLLALARSPQLVIRQEACAGITRISREAQPELLASLVASREKPLVIFAAAQIGRLRSVKGTMPLIDALEENEDEEVRIVLLKSLAVLQDRRAFKALQRWARRSSGKVQEEALSGLVRFTATLSAEVIRHCLECDNVRVKEMVYRAILRRRGLHWEETIARGLRDDVGGELTAKILPSIREVRSLALARVLLNLALMSPSLQIRALAASAIRRVKSDSIRQLLLDEERQALGNQRIPYIHFLAEYGEDPASYHCLTNYAKQGDPAVRLAALDGLARWKKSRQKLIPILLAIVREEDRFSFAAASSLSELMAPPVWDVVTAVLTLDEQRRSLAIQLFLRYLIRLPPGVEIPDEVAQQVSRFLTSEQPALRSVAVRCLVRLRQESVFERLVAIASTDADASVRSAAFHSIVSLARGESSYLREVLSLMTRSSSSWRMVSRLFREVTASPSEFEPLLGELLKRSTEFSENHGQGDSFTQARWLLLARYQIGQQKSVALDLFRREIFSEPERQQFLRLLNTLDPEELGVGHWDFMAKQYERVSAPAKLEYLKFFQEPSRRSQLLEKAIFRAMMQEQDPVVWSKVTDVVAAWIRGEQG